MHYQIMNHYTINGQAYVIEEEDEASPANYGNSSRRSGEDEEW
jgi:hypothetical protein